MRLYGFCEECGRAIYRPNIGGRWRHLPLESSDHEAQPDSSRPITNDGRS